MPGYGDAAAIDPLTYGAIADRLVALLDVLEVAVADLVGLSFGGMHALHTALRHPERVGRLVLVDTSPAFGMDGTRPDDWRRARLAPIEGGATPADMAPDVLDAIAGMPLDPDIRRELIEAFGRISVTGFRAAVECLPTNDIRDRLGAIRHPSLVIVGSEDFETPVEYARVLADGLADSELHIVEGAGHLTPAEVPARFNDLVADFLQRG